MDGFTKELGDVEARGNVFDKCDGAIGLICFTEEAKGVNMSGITIDDNYFRDIGYAHDTNSDGDDSHSLGIIHIWDHSGNVNLSGLKLTNNLFLYTEDRVINLEQVKRKKKKKEKNNVAILKKKSGMNFLRVTDRNWNETYYNSLSKAKTYIGNFGKIKWVE